MRQETIPSSVAAFLAAHGAEGLAESGLGNPGPLVRVFRASAPDGDAGSLLTQDNLTWLSAVLDCISVMDERLYEHYRAMIDLFRGFVFRVPREDLLSCPAWEGLRDRAIRLNLLPGDLYGSDCPRPHLAVPDVYLQMKEAGCE